MPIVQTMAARSQSIPALSWLNFFLADVATGIGPFLAAFLAGRDGWSGTRIGVALAAASVAGLLVQTPIGTWLDSTKFKRLALFAAVVAIACASVAIIVDSHFVTVIIVQAIYGVAGAVILPAVAAITLGIVGRRAFGRTQARMQAWNHAGNVAAALALGALGKVGGLSAALCLLIGLSVAASLSLARIRERDIDHRVARGSCDDESPQPWFTPLRDRNFLALLVAFLLFHFANAAMLPLAGMKLGQGDPNAAAPYMAACIVGAQAVMIPVAAVCGVLADRWGWKHVLAAGFLVLALRGFLFPLSDQPAWIIAVQLLDGIGAGLFGVLSVVAIEEITSGSGRFNAMQGLATTFVGIGASVSTIVAGSIVDHFGFGWGFGSLAAIALVAFVVLMLFVDVPNADKHHSSRNAIA